MKQNLIFRTIVYVLIVIVLFGSGLVIGLSFFGFFDLGPIRIPIIFEPEPEEITGPIYGNGMRNAEYYDAAYESIGKVKSVKAGSALVAHHLLVDNEIAEIMETVGRKNIDTVVLVSPNHFDTGRMVAQTSHGNWETPYGMLVNDHDTVNELDEAIDFLEDDHVTFEGEHGISTLTPFIKKSFPNAKVVPIVVHESMTHEQAEELGQAIAEQLPKAFVITSADMSHNLPEYVSSFHDDVTERVLARGGCESCELEVDSNAGLQVMFAVNEARGTEEWHRTYRGSSALMGVAPKYEDNTSHLMGYFTKGDPIEESLISFTFVGDIMLSRYVGQMLDEHGADYPWEQITNFLRGAHHTVGNFEGQICAGQYDQDWEEPPYQFSSSLGAVEAMAERVDVVSLSNNHSSDFGSACLEETRDSLDQLGVDWFGGYSSLNDVVRIDEDGWQVSLIGYNQFAADETELIETIEAEVDRFVIVYPHWGTEYLSQSDARQQKLAQTMVEAGADLIIGSHPHVIQESALIDSTPVYYSLGNFIFDQEEPETNQGLAVGVILDGEEVIIYPMPYYIVNTQPVPINDSEAAQFID